MIKHRLIVSAVVDEKRTHADVASEFGVSRAWVTRLVSRYKREGESAFESRSRCPETSPTRVDDTVVELIIKLREELTAKGLDAGATTIQWHLEQHHQVNVSVATIWRYLNKNGLVTPQPKKRPKNSYIRFEADLPNETWQTDMTHWQLSDGIDVELLSFIDDHSRYALSVQTYERVNVTSVVDQFSETAGSVGLPASVLSDNGMYFTTRLSGGRGGRNRFEKLLIELGVKQKHSRPYHPTTCGKVERFQQTMKKYLGAQPQAETIDVLQVQVDEFIDVYNNRRPHRSLNRRTPTVVYNLLPKAKPGNLVEKSHYRIRYDIVDKTGKVTLRHDSKIYHIGIGRLHKNTAVTMLIHDLNIRIINSETGEIIRKLVLDPNRNYQPQNRT